ncbi:MAG: hypothetical protein DDT42_02093 [candidate division WS2 bacterium]|uniref:Uncharacterized protein n=1 Tax=Psychracetigena formicireducens TaxID=2986056 RepID=A0A9E2BJB2_PSYF1|nr:hypothetical protein [Candidatus Psychracetigena formicireducens]
MLYWLCIVLRTINNWSVAILLSFQITNKTDYIIWIVFIDWRIEIGSNKYHSKAHIPNEDKQQAKHTHLQMVFLLFYRIQQSINNPSNKKQAEQ